MIKRRGVPMEHAAFAYSQALQPRATQQNSRHPAAGSAVQQKHVVHNAGALVLTKIRSTGLPCKSKKVYMSVSLCTPSTKRGALMLTHEQSTYLKNMAHTPPPSRPATCAVRRSVLLCSCYAACTAHALIGAHERRALEHPSASTRWKHSN